MNKYLEWWPYTKIEEPIKIPTSFLTIYFRNRTTLEWSRPTKDHSPWDDFYKWWHSELGSYSFTIVTPINSTTFLRAEILKFVITLGHKEESNE